MSKTLFIHSGTPKTGSSFLQSTFNMFSDKLNAAGILYPGVSRGIYQPESNVDINGQLLTRLLIHKTKEQLQDIKERLLVMLDSLFMMGKDKVFLSDETLGILNSDIWELINDACTVLNIDLIIFSYFREPEKYYPSHWAQLVRNHGEIKSLLEFAKTTNLQVWRNIIVINEKIVNSYAFSYEGELNREFGLLYSVAKVLNVDVQIFLDPAAINRNVNPSLSLYALTAIRFINDEFGREIGRKLNEELTSLIPINRKFKPAFDDENKAMIRNKHSEEITKCRNLYQKSISNLNL